MLFEKPLIQNCNLNACWLHRGVISWRDAWLQLHGEVVYLLCLFPCSNSISHPSIALLERIWKTMVETQDQRKHLSQSKSIGRCIVSCIFVFLTQLVLTLVPRFFSASSFLTQLAFSALLLLLFLGFGGWCRRRLLQVRASAPAFVFFNILFIWGFYVSVIRQGQLDLIQ